MRKNIYEILKGNCFDLKREYGRLYELFYLTEDEILDPTISDMAYDNFMKFDRGFTGRCISFDDFNQTYGFNFSPAPKGFSVDYFVSFCEYVYNVCIQLHPMGIKDFDNKLERATSNVLECLGMMGYKEVIFGEISYFVEDKPEVTAVAEIVEEPLAMRILEYNHHRLKGDLIQKQIILKMMADAIEDERRQLKSINATLETQLYQLMNKFIRHDHSQTPYIATMTNNEIESVYDDIYQMWLLAKLELDHIERRKHMTVLLEKINAK